VHRGGLDGEWAGAPWQRVSLVRLGLRHKQRLERGSRVRSRCRSRSAGCGAGDDRRDRLRPGDENSDRRTGKQADDQEEWNQGLASAGGNFDVRHIVGAPGSGTASGIATSRSTAAGTASASTRRRRASCAAAISAGVSARPNARRSSCARVGSLSSMGAVMLETLRRCGGHEGAMEWQDWGVIAQFPKLVKE
jgi:hypothetical protein